MQQREEITLNTESNAQTVSHEDNRQAYQAPTFRALASSETQTGAATNPDVGSLS